MITGFNPSVSNNRNQRTNFKALPIDKIIKNDAEADMFLVDVYKGKVPKTEENIKDLFVAFHKTNDVGVKSFLEEAAEKWGLKIPPKK